MSYNQKCEYFSREFIGHHGTVPACDKRVVLEAFDCSDCEYNPDNKKITNADRIRAMSDEELAKYLAWLVDKQTCSPEWLIWLKDEVKT